jgi:SP family general alpha glucoside:H+ symporter-like MFS transporter
MMVTTDGIQVTGYGVEKIGYRKFILGVLVYQCAITTLFFVAPDVRILLLAECLCGVAFGVFFSSRSPSVLPVAVF